MKRQTLNSNSFETENLKRDHVSKKHVSKNDYDDDVVLHEEKEDYNMVDKEDDYIEPSGPRKEDLRNTDIILDDDDFDDEF